MSMNELQKQTNANIQAKANLIWEIATHLVGLFKPHEYGKVILPMTVLKRFDDALKETKDAVVEMAKKLDEQHVEGAARDGILRTVAKRDFYNTSSFDFAKLIVEPDKIEDYFEEYLQGFSDNVKDIIENFDFDNIVKLMVKGGVLFVTLQEFNSAKADMSPDKITSADMGYIFEELIRKFSESYDEQAGAHFTSRDIIYLMTELLVAPEKTDIMKNGCTKTAYDMAMGTSQMLGCLTERLKEINSEADLTCFGQEFNPETYAIAKADMLIKGGNASGMKYGDTLSNRNIEALNEILSDNTDKDIVLGTHGTALSTILNFYDNSFECEDFLRIIDWMPYIIELDFEGDKLVGKHEHCYVEKEFKGNQRADKK